MVRHVITDRELNKGVFIAHTSYMSLTGSRKAAAFNDTMLTHELMEYMGTLSRLEGLVITRTNEGRSDDIHQQDAYDISLQEWFPIILSM